MNNGAFVISLDYEMMWGCLEWSTPHAYGKTHVAQVPIVIDRILNLLEKYEVRATIATVGMIMTKDKSNLLSNCPDYIPTYDNQNLSPYANDYIQNIAKQDSFLYFSPETIELLKSKSFIEIGTHTFCHYYCEADGQNVEQFEADLARAIEIANSKSIEIKSIVFPKNQVTDTYLKICHKYGLSCYRGNSRLFYKSSANKLGKLRNRLCRLIDTYLSIWGNSSIPYSDIEQSNEMVNVQASRFLRPYNRKGAFLERFKIKRICNEIVYAAQNKELYHLWWHPHNFGNNIDKNIETLEKILQVYKKCHDQYGMHSYTMKEFADKIIENA